MIPRAGRRTIDPVLRIAALLALACSGATERAEPVGTLPEWKIDSVPAVVIGEDGSEAGELHRIAGTFRLSTGHIVVANGGTFELRLFDPGVRFIAASGRRGGGPGEFMGMGWTGRSEDTVTVADPFQLRITRYAFTPEGRLVETMRFTARSDQGRASVQGRLPDGQWLVGTPVSPRLDGPQGVHEFPVWFGLTRPDGGGTIRWLGQFPGAVLFVHNPTGDIRNAAVGPIAFSPWTYAVTNDSSIWIGHGGWDSLLVYHPPHDAARAVTLPIPAHPVPDSLVEVFRRQDLTAGREPRSRAFAEARYAKRQLPTALPLFNGLLAGPDGEIWVQEYAAQASHGARYLVLDRTGSPVATVRVPSGFRIREPGPDYVLGVHTDPDGVERVLLYGLARR